MREKVDERRHFYSHEKVAIIKKSKGKCAHCGCVLKKPSEMTIEHIIPIVKGGTNDENNLAVLCEKCNKYKGELVLLPSSYLKHLTPKYKSEVDRLFERYCKEKGYFTGKNYLFVDKMEIDIYIKLWTTSKKANHLKSFLYKACYSDLDSIYNFCWDYYAYYGINVDVWDIVSSYFDRGAIYFTRNTMGEVDFILFVSLGSLVRPDGISYDIAVTVICKPELSLAVNIKNINGGRHRSAYSSDFSYFKCNAIITSFLNGCLRSTEDLNISYGADVSIFWYVRDGRIGGFFQERSQGCKWVNPDSEDEGLMECVFTTKNEIRSGYDWELSSDWNGYLRSIYDVEDEIKLYSVLRDKQYTKQLELKAKTLRKARERLKEDVI